MLSLLPVRSKAIKIKTAQHINLNLITLIVTCGGSRVYPEWEYTLDEMPVHHVAKMTFINNIMFPQC